MKKGFLIAYGILYLALTLLSIFGTFSLGKFSISILMSITFSAIYLTGFWAYTFDKKIWTAKAWRRIFYLLCFATTSSLLVGALLGTAAQAVDAIFGLLISVPLIYCLFQYSKADQSYWMNTEENLKGTILKDLIVNKPELEVEKEDGASKAIVTVSTEGGEYVVRITRINGENEESFKNTFSNLGQLALFIEQYTFIRVSDFESKYA
ncbi:hypothetical protein SNR37_001754 [Agarivorans aestuarii]|uniref:Uncharacterized protein n=1 Tax=Agarivorans aestuarii TaxID=1563703 RepID=A0ABU7FZ47_9ALTE|nr:hypothetical protein [Agarivorans aestuarii]MEE1672433.1 hypothetical protein [Agarivorans aestuarii]